ncbi:breast cancer type 2 susceptibility protein isoform X2 [Siniperca chuatsi]|uniref:breast cancer type 2 susceptibility protein isoform X2 n=1 Tax=Siniperca chuatsi TaxID=119488 RepID=UPI001CE21707|nr:breast cancer type 2 susceptibility protein isoform X2 [Siniperca chuatsi]
MDLPSKNMYDTFRDEIWKELGPLDPDWFEALTAQTFTNEENVSYQDDLCANLEGNFKTPFDKTAVDSQLFSTPKVFRRCQVVSPETENEQSFTAEQEKETLPWMATHSPYLFPMSKEGVPGAKYGDMLHTPQTSPVSNAKHISESLGAQIHPDMSWTSSLNTPSAVPSTLILSKTDESPCPVSASADKNVVFVRKLFPSLSNASRVASPKNNDMPTVHQGIVSPEASQNPESHDSPQSSLNQSDSVWRQKLPDAIEDGEIRSTVASVLDGAENVLSIFFTNSSSALRKVKTDRIKRKQIIPTKERGCSSTDISTTNNAASSEQRTANQEHSRLPSSPPVKTGEIGFTQWSPLSLSEIPPSTVDTSCHDNSPATQVESNILTEQLQSDSDSGQLVRPPMKLTNFGFTKKKRTFVYTVETLKPQVQGKETQSQKMDSSPGIPDSGQEVNVKQLGKVPDEADCCSIGKHEMQKQGNLTEENLPPSVQAKVQDFDMSQLCRDFAQDFSQMSDLGKLSKVAEDMPQNGFSPSACLSAMKREKQKARQANLHHDCDGVSNRRHVSTTNQKNSINEGATSDSGFQSAVADITHVTASSFVLPSSENNGQSQQWTGFKTIIHRTTHFPSTNKGNGKANLDDILQEAETDAKLSSAIKESQTMGPGKESELHIKSTSTQLSSSAKGTVDSINCIPLNGPVLGSLPEKTVVFLPSVHASGFKTASNKGIHISSANLERAKLLFEETKEERTFSDQLIKSTHDNKAEISSPGSVKNTTSNSNQPPTSSEKCVDISCQLTASQKADVTELCTLMEEADSQFEFTPFKTAKLKQHCQDNTTSPTKVDKELDPDFLMGIDFDDSFSSDAEKHLALTAMHDKMTLVSDGKTNRETSITSKSTGFPLSGAMKKENFSTEDVSSSSKHISEGSSIMSAEHKSCDKAGPTETSKLENKNPLMLGVGFKTAGGNVLRISKKCLSKARALFADLEENLVTSEKSPDKQSSESDAKTQHKPSVDNHTGNLLHHKEDNSQFTSYGDDTGGRIQGCFSNMKESVCSVRQVTGIRDEDATKCFKNSTMETTTCQSGFQMANGKGISISAKSMQEADAFFKDCDVKDSNAGMSVNHKKSIEPLPGSVSHKKNLLKFKNVQRTKVNFSEEPSNEFENVNDGPAACHTEVVQNNVEIHNFGFKNTSALTNATSFHENPFSIAKALSSPSCTTSKNIGSSAINEMANGGGFCTASGKKVSMSADAMKKAECLLNEFHTLEDTNKQLKKKGDALRTGHLTNQIQVSPSKNDGFQTASGKGVAISSAALKKAKLLLSECDEDEIGVRPTHSKIPVHGPPPRNSGFLAASGKPVALSAEALQMTKALFSDISFSVEIPPVSDTSNIDKKQDDAENTERMHCGFSTAGGTKVHVSEKNLLKAKYILKEFDEGSISAKAMQEADVFFKDCDIMDGNDGMLVKHEKSIAHVSESGSEKKNLSKSKQDQRVTNISEEPGSGRTEFENVTVGTIVNHEKMLHRDDVEIHKDVFKNTLGSTKAVSLHGNPSLMAKPLSSLLCTSKNIGSSAINELSNGGGFCTASGKKVSVSEDAMTKAKSLLNESATFEETNKQLKQNEDTLPPQNGGFQTASSKGVAISSAALMKTEILSECEGVEDKTHSKISVHGPPPRNSGFLAAGGKPVAFSTEALQKAKALFSDISFSAEIPPVSHTWNNDKKHKDARNDTEKIHCGFTTAGGAKVHVSQKNLFKAKNLLKEFADECHDSNSYSTRPRDTEKTDLSKLKNVKRTSNYNLTSASDKDMPTKEIVPHVVKPLTSLQETDHENKTLQSSSARGCIFSKDKAPTDAFKFKEVKITPLRVGNLHDSPGEEMSSVLDYEINRISSSEGSKVNGTEESSVLNFQLLNLRGCTETQQKFLAQEALDCTKALLEDESLAGQSLSMTSENVSLQDYPKSSNRSLEEQKRTGKRLVKDTDMTGQPPLKRRLLEEFDRTVDGPRDSTLHPEKSSPNGVMKDRRVFKYSVALHPNITRPHRSGKNYVETTLQKTTPIQSSTPNSRSTHSKMPAFVPPLFKNAKTESRKNTVLKDNIRTPSAFVPPFKKQRTIVQENFSKPREEEEEATHHHLLITPFNSNTYVPPTKKTQSTKDVSGIKSKYIQSVALTDTTNDNLMNNQNLPVGCGSEDSAAEASRVDDPLSRSQDMFQDLHSLELARDMQDMRIRKKKRQTIRPLPGSLFLTKTSGVLRISLKTAVNGQPPARYTPKQLYGHGVHQHVYEITSENAESFRFSLQQFIKQEAFIDGGGIQLADGGWLIPSNDETAGKEEFYRALCDTPGVDPKLISEEWVYNHYRWIVWKQASMERSFPQTMGSLCLTPEQVLLQLKYRYDIEVDHSRRPALRKIMERDDTPAKTLVLCVCGVVSMGHSPKRQSFSDTKTPQGADGKVENPSAVIWLTDGWYAIKAQLDEPLTAMLHKGRLAVGGKLIVHGAQLMGSQDACSPLEAPESLMLKICANSSRPTRWDAKMGFHRDPRPFLLPVSCLYSNGGPVGCVDIIILRSYPIQWMERKPDGGVVFRSVRAEEREARRYNSHKQKAMEILFAKIQAEFEKEEKGNKPQRRRQTVSRQDIASLQDGEELFQAVGDDPSYLEAHLSEQQLETLHAYRHSLMEKKQAELQDRYRRALENAENSEGGCLKRDVTPVWRLCFADSLGQPGSVYQLNLWRPSSDLQSLLKEGCRYKVYNLTASDGKKHGGSTTVQLTGTKKTQFQDLQASQEWLLTCFHPRVSSPFVDLQNPEFQPLCGEVDLTGYVISIIDGHGSSPGFYLTDGKLNFVKVRCFSSLAQSGLEDVVKPLVLLALSNLQLRGQSTSPTPVVYAGDLTVFSTNPKEVHLQESLRQLRNLVQGQENFFLTAEEKLSHLVKSDGLSSISSPALQTRTPASTTDRRQDTRTSVTFQQPVRSFGSFTPVGRNPPAANGSTEKDPSSLKRRRALDYLSRIPSPPPLSQLGSVASPCVNKTFNPPRRSGTPSTLKTVQTPARKPVDSPMEDEWVNDEELAMIDTQALLVGDLL